MIGTTSPVERTEPVREATHHSGLGLAARFAAVFAGLSIILGLAMVVFVLLLPFRVARIRAGNIAGRLAGRWVCRVGGITVDVTGAPPADQPAIFVQNHAGSVDLFLAIQLCPAPGSGTVKKELRRVPLIGWAYWLSGHLMLDRGDTVRSIRAMDRMTRLLRERGISLWILPEGTRSADGRLQPFKRGFAHLAVQTGLPIVPVVVHDADRRWHRGLTVRPGPIAVEFLPPVSTADWSADTLEAHIADIHSIFEQNLTPRQRPLPAARTGE